MNLSPLKGNCENVRSMQKYHHSLKDHRKFSKIAKLGREMLNEIENIAFCIHLYYGQKINTLGY